MLELSSFVEVKQSAFFLLFFVGAFRQATSARRSEALLIGDPAGERRGARGGRGVGGEESGGLSCPVIWRTGHKSQGYIPPGVKPREVLSPAQAREWVLASHADLSIPALTHSTGGTTRALERWHEYVRGVGGGGGGLPAYAKTRNNPLMPKGVSRMSGLINIYDYV
jgi:hypothetical protein